MCVNGTQAIKVEACFHFAKTIKDKNKTKGDKTDEGPFFISPSEGVFNGKRKTEIVQSIKVHHTHSSGYLPSEASVLKSDRCMYCTVSLRGPKAFGIMVRLDPEPALRVCLKSQTMQWS